MADQEFYYCLNQLQLRPGGRRWWFKAIAICAVLGGIYGASLGSAIGAVPGAADVIEITAGVMAVICGVPGARLGSLLGIVTRNRFGRLFLGMFATIGGAILGGFLATMILLALGAILGAVGGWVLARTLLALRHGNLRRFLVGIVGAVLGMFIGAILWAVNLNQATALAGATLGLGNRGRRRPAASLDGHWGDELAGEHARPQQRELYRCDFPARRSRRAFFIHFCSNKRESWRRSVALRTNLFPIRTWWNSRRVYKIGFRPFSTSWPMPS